MKTIKVLAMTVMLLTASVTIAAVNNLNDGYDPSIEIASLLENPSFNFEGNMEAVVSFIINEEGELVVLCVKTENNEFESFVKDRLNYHKLSKNSLKKGEEYKIPVKLILKRA